MKISHILKSSKIGENVTVSGWVITCRKQKNMCFIKCNDGSCCSGIQLIWEDVDTDKLSDLQTGCSISVEGLLVESPAQGQDVEVKVLNLKVIALSFQNLKSPNLSVLKME